MCIRDSRCSTGAARWGTDSPPASTRERRARSSRSPPTPWRHTGSRALALALAGRQLLHQRVVDLEVGVDVLHVVAVLEQLHQPQHLLGAFAVQLDGALRD